MKNNKLWNEYTEQEKHDLIVLAKNDDNNALGKIWMSMYGALRLRASKFLHISGSLDIEDLVQESYLVFKRSVDAFDEDKGAGLLGYVINNFSNEIHKIISKKGTNIKLPAGWNEYKFKISKAMIKNGITSVNKDNVAAISRDTGLTENSILNISNTLGSTPIYSTNDELYVSNQEEDIIPSESIVILERIFDELDSEEVKYFRMLFGIGTKQMTKTILINEYGVTRHKLDSIINKARKVAENE